MWPCPFSDIFVIYLLHLVLTRQIFESSFKMISRGVKGCMERAWNVIVWISLIRPWSMSNIVEIWPLHIVLARRIFDFSLEISFQGGSGDIERTQKVNGRTDEQTDGHTDRGKDGQMDGGLNIIRPILWWAYERALYTITVLLLYVQLFPSSKLINLLGLHQWSCLFWKWRIINGDLWTFL